MNELLTEAYRLGVSDFCPPAFTLVRFGLLETRCNKERVGSSPGVLHNQAGSPKGGELLVFMPCGPGRPKGPYLHSVLGCKSKTRCLSSPLFINEASVLIQTLRVYSMEGEGAGGGVGRAHLEASWGQSLLGTPFFPTTLSCGVFRELLTSPTCLLIRKPEVLITPIS